MRGTGLGALIGGIAGGGTGAAIGALAGAAGGTAIASSKKGEQLQIPSESLLEFRLEQPAKLPRSKLKVRARNEEEISQGYVVCSSGCLGMDFQTPVTQAKELTHENLAVPNPGAPD